MAGEPAHEGERAGALGGEVEPLGEGHGQGLARGIADRADGEQGHAGAGAGGGDGGRFHIHAERAGGGGEGGFFGDARGDLRLAGERAEEGVRIARQQRAAFRDQRGSGEIGGDEQVAGRQPRIEPAREACADEQARALGGEQRGEARRRRRRADAGVNDEHLFAGRVAEVLAFLREGESDGDHGGGRLNDE